MLGETESSLVGGQTCGGIGLKLADDLGDRERVVGHARLKGVVDGLRGMCGGISHR